MARVAIVTGGTRGIGEAISLALKDMGMTVAANYAGNDERAREFSDRTGISAYKWDVADYDACQDGVKQVEEQLGQVDIVVNNAGITRDGTILKMTYQMWKDVMDTNLGGCFNMAKAVFPGMRERKWGRIVNISSGAARGAGGVGPHYNASKAGMEGMTRGYAARLVKDGITVNSVAPSLIETDMVKQGLASNASRIPLGRFGTPEECAQIVMMLVGNAYMTGQTVALSGGMSFL